MRKISRQFLVVIFCLSWTGVLYAATAQLRHIGSQMSQDLRTDRLVLVLSRPTIYHYFRLHDPERLVVDFAKTELATKIPSPNSHGDLINNIRVGARSDGNLRVVFDLQQAAVVDKAIASPDKKVIQFYLQNLARTKLAKPTLRQVIVVIDPGHGGRDPGAVNPTFHILEKDIVLHIAQDLYKRIQQEPGMVAILTRGDDHYVGLRGRIEKARQAKADIFISIHADAYQDTKSRGASVYALSLKGASSEAARWLAEKENYSELSGVDLKDKGDALRSVLIDLSQSATINASLRLGYDVLSQLKRLTDLHYYRVEQAPFAVLKSPDIPSILVETGFLSNPTQAKELNTHSHQHKIATAILNGIREYFYQNPPMNSWIATHKIQQHRVVAHESLASLAQTYGVTVDAIKNINHLSTETVSIGQTLLIPQPVASL